MDVRLKKVLVAIVFCIALTATTITGVAFNPVTAEAAHTHSYDRTVTYRWDGYSSCTFNLKCITCGKTVSKKAKITKKIVKKPTCTKDGKYTYEAKVKVSSAYCVVNKDKVIEKTGHKLSASKITKATFDKNGAITGKCSNCKKSIKTTIARIASVELGNAVVRYDGGGHTPNVICKDSNGKLIDSKYYNVTVTDTNGNSVVGPVEIGNYTVKVAFKTRYSGTKSLNFTIIDDSDNEEITSPTVSESLREYWDGFSSDYYYSQLNTAEKKLYDKLDDKCFKLLTEDIDFKGEKEGYIPSVKVPYLDSKSVDRTVSAFFADNPQYFFIRNGYSMSYNSSESTVWVLSTGGLSDGEYRLSVAEKAKLMLDEWVNAAAKKTSDFEKLRSIHDSIVKTVEYEDPDGASCSTDQSLASVIIYKKSVCAGYTCAIAACYNKLGYKTASAYNNDHAWNKVCVGGKWYVVDATWDDPTGNNPWDNGGDCYEYFLISDARTIQKDDQSFHYEKPVGEGLVTPSADADFADYPSSMSKWYN